MVTNGNGTPENTPPPPQAGPSSGGLFGIPNKWLFIGGGGGGALVIVIVVVVLFLFVFGGGNPQPTSILDLVPEDAEVITRMDLARILDNDLLADDFFDEEDWGWLEDDRGIELEDLSEIVVAVWSGGQIIVAAGNFDPDYIREELEDADNEENSYRGYEVWEGPDGGAGTLLDGYFVFSDTTRPVENVLKNLYNEAGSLERADEDNEMKQLLARIGAGHMVFATTRDDVCRVERCEGYGWAITEVDESDEEATVEIALLFRNERGAENAADDYDEVADFLEQEGFDIEDTEADGVFVTGVAILDLAEEESSAPQQQQVPAAVAATAQAPMAFNVGNGPAKQEFVTFCSGVNGWWGPVDACQCWWDVARGEGADADAILDWATAEPGTRFLIRPGGLTDEILNIANQACGRMY